MPAWFSRSLGAQLVHLPAVLVLAGLAALLVGLARRGAALAWPAVTWTMLPGLSGGLLGLPEAVLRTSPFGVDAGDPGGGVRACSGRRPDAGGRAARRRGRRCLPATGRPDHVG
jgi:putative exporter of polyketide antibiotics